MKFIFERLSLARVCWGRSLFDNYSRNRMKWSSTGNGAQYRLTAYYRFHRLGILPKKSITMSVYAIIKPLNVQILALKYYLL